MFLKYITMGLEGQELLAKLDELGASATKEEQMLASGYFTLRKDGTKRLAQSQFYIALMDARSAKTRLERASTANQEENNIQQTHPPESSEEANASTDEVKVSVY